MEGRAQPVHQHRRGVQPRLRVRAQQVQGFQVRFRRVFFSRFDERSFSRKLSTGEQSHVSRNSKRVSVFSTKRDEETTKRKDDSRFFVSLPSPPSRRDRLLFGIFSEDGDAFLGSGVSGPIRVLANNDVPKGAACLRIRCSLGGKRARLGPRFYVTRRAEFSPPGPRGTSPGIPGAPRGRARASRHTPF